MSKIRQDIIDHIIDIARIEEVVADFPEIKLKSQAGGVRYMGICPFHNDKGYGNFSVYPKDNVFKCFKCEESGDSVTFLMKHLKISFPDAIRWLGKKYNVEVDNVPFNYTPPPPRPTPPPLPTLVLPRTMVRKYMASIEADNLVRFITTQVKWGNEQRARIATVLHDYCVGHSTIHQRIADHDFTVFWQIDLNGLPRTAHYMKYKENGHRLKENEGKYTTDWMHSLLSRGGYTQFFDPDKQAVRPCLFGEHLLRKYPTATVKIVESEKTAILMAIAYGNNPMQVWVACAGASNLTRERLRPLIQQHRNVVLYPDRDGIDLWKQKADAIYYDRLSIDTKPVKEWWQECDGPKADIADVVLRMIGQIEPKTIGEVMADMPIVKPLIEKLSLTTDCND